MSDTQTDARPRGASRRNTLLAFGGAALAATLARAFDAEAKNRPSKRNKQDRKKANARCKAQVGQCNIVIGIACAVQDDPADCEARVQPCCDFGATCNAGAMLECVLTGGV